LDKTPGGVKVQPGSGVSLPPPVISRPSSLFLHIVVTYVVFYESIKRELKRRLIYEYRCDERLKTKNEESTRLADIKVLLIMNQQSES
jgi:hypothetical protein